MKSDALAFLDSESKGYNPYDNPGPIPEPQGAE
jgi:hypothetical protein